MRSLRHDFTTGLTWCRAELHVIPKGQEPTKDGRRCRECRRASRIRAQARYERKAKGMLAQTRRNPNRRGTK